MDAPVQLFGPEAGHRPSGRHGRQGLDAGPAGDLVLALPAAEPKQLRFAVTFFAGAGRFSPAPAAGLDTFQDYCAQAGWHRAASSDQVQVFYSEDPAAVPIDTDPAAELENIRRSIGKPMMRNYLALLLLCLLEVAFQCYQIWTDPVETLASPLPYWRPQPTCRCWC